MGKFAALYDEAERLYVQDGKTLEDIKKTLQVSTKTLSQWKKDGEWDEQRKRYLKSERHFKDILHELKHKLAVKALESMNPQDVYALVRVVAASKPYIDVELKKIEEDEKKGMSKEDMKRLAEEILESEYGIKR